MTASLSQPTIMTMDNIVPFHVSSTTNMSHFQDMTHTTSNTVHESPLTASMQRPHESGFVYPFTVEETNPKMIHELMVHRDPSEHFIRESSHWSLDQRILESLLSASDIFLIWSDLSLSCRSNLSLRSDATGAYTFVITRARKKLDVFTWKRFSFENKKH